MKKFTKIVLGCAITCAAVGLGLSVAGLAMGAASTGKDVLAKAINDTLHSDNIRWSVSVLRDEEDWDDLAEDWNESISPHTENGSNVYEFDSVKNLDAELSSDEFFIRQYDGNNLRVETSDENDKVRVKQDGDTIKIKSLSKLSGTQITVYYPENFEFGEMDIEVDAGTVHLEDTLQVRDLEIQVGAGEMVSDEKLVVNEMSIDVGAGEVQIKALDVVSLGAECGLGSMNITLAGKESEYNYKVECGMGSVTVGDEKYSGISEKTKVTNAGAKGNLEVECGLGDVKISFEN